MRSRISDLLLEREDHYLSVFVFPIAFMHRIDGVGGRSAMGRWLKHRANEKVSVLRMPSGFRAVERKSTD